MNKLLPDIHIWGNWIWRPLFIHSIHSSRAQKKRQHQSCALKVLIRLFLYWLCCVTCGFAPLWPERDPSLVLCVQVDSGYNTYSTCTTSLMDGVGTDSQSKEPQDTHTAEEGLVHSKRTKSKVTHTHRAEITVSLIIPFIKHTHRSLY